MPSQPYRTFPYKGFGGGLNLRDGPDVVAEDQAIDALNVLFTTRGSVAQRSGYGKLTQTPGAARYDSLAAYYKSDGTKQIIAGAGNRLEALNTGGSVIATTTAPTANPHFFERFGGPTAEHLYIANGTDAVRRWTGVTFETPAYSGTTPDGKFLGLSVTDNRLVNARFGGTVAGDNASTVRFSDEGDPLTWGSTHYQDLTPGDGEVIMGVATWRDLVLVFKQSKFFVFYGQSVDDEGEPVFNYRPVDAGVGLAASRALAIAEQGVYFLDRTGIYFTNGGQPSRVSDIVEPVFHGNPSVYFRSGILNDGSIDQTSMVYHDERLWLSYPSGSNAVNDRQLIFDPHEAWWSLADMPAGPMINFRPSDVEELVFGYSSGLNHLGRYVDGLYPTDDAGFTRANMVTNPKAGNGVTTNWTNVQGAPATAIAPGADPALPVGVTTAFNKVGAASGDGTRFDHTVELGKTYRYSVYVRINSNTAAFNCRVQTTTGTVRAVLVAGDTSTHDWQRIDVSYTAVASETLRFMFRQSVGGAINFDWTAAIIEEYPTLEAYFDGDIGGGVWTGADDLSVSNLLVPGAAGNAISCIWQGGWFNYSTPLVKTIRESKISGTGLVTVQFFRDYRQASSLSVERELSPPTALYDDGQLYDTPGLVYGPAGIVQAKAIRKAIRGEAFSIAFSNSTLNRSFKVHRLTTHIREARVPSVVKVR